MVAINQPGKPVSPGTYTRQNHSVTINRDGSIKVKRGDWISKYAVCLYGDARAGWKDFGRKEAGKLVALANPDRINTGETLYHLPTAQRSVKSAAPVASVTTKTNAWVGVGVDIQYTLGVVGQQLMVFTLRSLDDEDRLAVVLVDGYKFGLSLDLTTNGYVMVATGLESQRQLHNQNFQDKMQWDFTLALGLNWGKMAKNGAKAGKATKQALPVAKEGTRMIRRRLTPQMRAVWNRVKKDLDRMADEDLKKFRLPSLPSRDTYVKMLKQMARLTPDEYGQLVKAARTAMSTLKIDFDSPIPQVHAFGVVGGGVGLGIHKSFGNMILIDSEGSATP